MLAWWSGVLGQGGRCVHLPLRRLVLRERPLTFRDLLWRAPARTELCGGRLWSEAQRYP